MTGTASRCSSPTSPARASPSSILTTAATPASRTASARARTAACPTSRSTHFSTTTSGCGSLCSPRISSPGPPSCASPSRHAPGSSNDCATGCFTSQAGSPATPARQSCACHATGPGPASSPPRSSACTRSQPQPADTPAPCGAATPEDPNRAAPPGVSLPANHATIPNTYQRTVQTLNTTPQHPAPTRPALPQHPSRPAQILTASAAIQALLQDRGRSDLATSGYLRLDPLDLEDVPEVRRYVLRKVLELDGSAIAVIGGRPPASLFDLTETAGRRPVGIRDGRVLSSAVQLEEGVGVSPRDFVQSQVACLDGLLETFRCAHHHSSFAGCQRRFAAYKPDALLNNLSPRIFLARAGIGLPTVDDALRCRPGSRCPPPCRCGRDTVCADPPERLRPPVGRRGWLLAFRSGRLGAGQRAASDCRNAPGGAISPGRLAWLLPAERGHQLASEQAPPIGAERSRAPPWLLEASRGSVPRVGAIGAPRATASARRT